MKRVLLFVFIVSAIATSFFVGRTLAQSTKTCPAVMNLDECKFTIDKVKFTAKIADGVTMTEQSPDKFNFAIVTLRIDKPVGRAINLPAADLTLHYRRTGEDFDVAPCEAISNFTISKNEDRNLDCWNGDGPGWVKAKTGSATRDAATIYVDAVFARVEPDVSTFWVCLGQRGSAAFDSSGWTP